MEMNAQATKLQAAENDLKQLGRCNPGHGKGSGSRREDCLQGRGRHNRDRIHDFVTLEYSQFAVARQAPPDVRFALLRGRREDILRSRVRGA